MRRFIILSSLLWGTTLWAAQINQTEIQNALAASQAVDHDATAIQGFANSVLPLVLSGWQYTVAGTTDTVTITAQEQSDMLAAYQVLKAQMQSDVNSLP